MVSTAERSSSGHGGTCASPCEKAESAGDSASRCSFPAQFTVSGLGFRVQVPPPRPPSAPPPLPSAPARPAPGAGRGAGGGGRGGGGAWKRGERGDGVGVGVAGRVQVAEVRGAEAGCGGAR